ncbi:hypothetical protein GOBAR_AA17061 [Gossypium barbadense]|uniref:Uncharacterized protein n=1 Tax=Gossypium barbadense TaxID=3634 RepID=A0A2P5XJU3_GOSBA|nr:hypothetical protein GOBAR_AA17061 [Gossypium barbadense]
MMFIYQKSRKRKRKKKLRINSSSLNEEMGMGCGGLRCLLRESGERQEWEDHDHDAEVCDHLKNKIEKLVKNEYSKKFLARHPKEIGQRKSQREEQVEKGPREERQSKEPNHEDSLTGERLLNMVTHMITGGSSFELPTLREEKDMPRFTLA